MLRAQSVRAHLTTECWGTREQISERLPQESKALSNVLSVDREALNLVLSLQDPGVLRSSLCTFSRHSLMSFLKNMPQLGYQLYQADRT